MMFRTPHTPSAAHARLRAALLIASVAVVASCDSSGPRTGKLSITVGGLPSTASAQVTLKGPANYSKALTGTEVVANLKPGEYSVIAKSVRDGATRFSALVDSQTVTITKSNVPVAASVDYTVSSSVWNRRSTQSCMRSLSIIIQRSSSSLGMSFT